MLEPIERPVFRVRNGDDSNNRRRRSDKLDVETPILEWYCRNVADPMTNLGSHPAMAPALTILRAAAADARHRENFFLNNSQDAPAPLGSP
jgi:hypothetical protein